MKKAREGLAEPIQGQLDFGLPGLFLCVSAPLLAAEGVEQQGNEEVEHLGGVDKERERLSKGESGFGKQILPKT